MKLGESSRSHAPDAAVRSHLVVVASPACALGSGLCEAGKAVLVQAFISKTSVATFDVSVLRRATRLDQDVFYLVP